LSSCIQSTWSEESCLIERKLASECADLDFMAVDTGFALLIWFSQYFFLGYDEDAMAAEDLAGRLRRALDAGQELIEGRYFPDLNDIPALRLLFGLGDRFTARELGKARRRLAAELHPDRGQDLPERARRAREDMLKTRQCRVRAAPSRGQLSLGDIIRTERNHIPDVGAGVGMRGVESRKSFSINTLRMEMADMTGFTSNSLAAELESWNAVLAQVPAASDVSVGRLL